MRLIVPQVYMTMRNLSFVMRLIVPQVYVLRVARESSQPSQESFAALPGLLVGLASW